MLQTLEPLHLRDQVHQRPRELARPLVNLVPQVEGFERLEHASPEDRLSLFDQLVDALNSVTEDAPRRSVLAFLAGYLANVVAGGAASMGLLEHTADRWPEVTAWAYLLGGVCERRVWTSAFDGLGRLVAREL